MMMIATADVMAGRAANTQAMVLAMTDQQMAAPALALPSNEGLGPERQP